MWSRQVKISDIFHSRHGQHLNNIGKRRLSKLIADRMASSMAGERGHLQRPVVYQPPPPRGESLSENSTLLKKSNCLHPKLELLEKP
ncbi:hypothetical protein J6590_022269 [Homalodisca vitripennis]|nr:hypothetical protein J6590_022269 [Homalodisca vitripennis]